MSKKEESDTGEKEKVEQVARGHKVETVEEASPHTGAEHSSDSGYY